MPTVAYDTATFAEDFGVTTVTTASFTIANVAKRCAFVSLGTVGSNGGVTSGPSVGGVNAGAVSGATGSDATNNITGYAAIAPPSGSVTATATWTTARSVSLGVIVANGVHQTIGMNNGTSATGSSPHSTDVTSNAGDLTVTVNANGLASSDQTTNQTKRITSFFCIDTGPGTAGPITHTWTKTGATASLNVGANFVQAPVEPPSYDVSRPWLAAIAATGAISNTALRDAAAWF